MCNPYQFVTKVITYMEHFSKHWPRPIKIPSVLKDYKRRYNILKEIRQKKDLEKNI